MLISDMHDAVALTPIRLKQNKDTVIIVIYVFSKIKNIVLRHHF